MPNLRKRSLPVTYAESSGEDSDEVKNSQKKKRIKTDTAKAANSQSRRRTRKPASSPDPSESSSSTSEDEYLVKYSSKRKTPGAAGDHHRGVKRHQAANTTATPLALSESDSDSEDEPKKEQAIPKRGRLRKTNNSGGGGGTGPVKRQRASRNTTPKAQAVTSVYFQEQQPAKPRATRRAKSNKSSNQKALKDEEFDWSAVVDGPQVQPSNEKEEKGKVKVKVEDDDEDDDDDDDGDWEEVDAGDDAADDRASPEVPEEGLEITVYGPGETRRRKSSAPDFEAELRRELARARRESQEDRHVVQLLCLLAHGRRLSAACIRPVVAAAALSLLDDLDDRASLEQLLGRCRDHLALRSDARHAEAVDEDVAEQLLGILGSGEAPTWKLLVLATCAIFRAAGRRTRLVHALRPIPLRPPPAAKAKGKAAKTPAKAKGKAKGKKEAQLSDDPDFQEATPSTTAKLAGKARRQLLSEEEEEEEGPCRASWWLEVLCEQRWITVDVVNNVVDQPAEMETPGHKEGPLYVMGFEAHGACKDVTARYASRWCIATRKLRLARSMWEEEILAGLRDDDRLLDAKEEDEIRERLLQQPPPRSTGDFNNHPLYAMTRHLKKYEVIYPPDAAPLLFHKGEPVYPRENVRTCHTRETWLKEARTVRVGEEPAKVVLSRTTSKQRVLLPNGQARIELFGLWQTQEYEPPVARDGLVPKNEHGNVDLFQERMLPVGCVHLRMPGLGRVARRLDIDAAQAMVGWEFHCGRWAHPVFDGWVVCREHAAALTLAWLEAERQGAEKAAAKREARAVANWRTLVRGLLIRRRLRARYDLSGSAAASQVSSIAAGMRERAGDAKNGAAGDP